MGRNIKEMDSDKTKYSFTNIGFEGKSSITASGNVRPFDGLTINRTNGKGTLTKFILNVEKVLMNCSTEKPKLLF